VSLNYILSVLPLRRSDALVAILTSEVTAEMREVITEKQEVTPEVTPEVTGYLNGPFRPGSALY